MLLHYVIWNTNPILLKLGSFEVRWYGLLFALGFLLGLQLWHYFMKEEGKPINDLEALVPHIVLGTILGARLGHVLFYDFSYFSRHLLEIFLPVTFTPTFKFTGYSGLASHGAAVGILTAIYIYVNYVVSIGIFPPKLTIKKRRRVGQSYLWVVDRMIIVVALAGCLIRIGNFMNSEIIGKPTNSKYGVLFARDVTYRVRHISQAIDKVEIAKSSATVQRNSLYKPIVLTITFKKSSFKEEIIRNFLEHNIKRLLTEDIYITKHVCEPIDSPLRYNLSKNKMGAQLAHISTLGIPRHPAQLYEACSCLLLFMLFFYQWRINKNRLFPGVLLGWFLTLVFSLRIVYEVFKESAIVYDTPVGPLRTPQLLSIPLVIVGIMLLVHSTNNKRRVK